MFAVVGRSDVNPHTAVSKLVDLSQENPRQFTRIATVIVLVKPPFVQEDIAATIKDLIGDIQDPTIKGQVYDSLMALYSDSNSDNLRGEFVEYLTFRVGPFFIGSGGGGLERYVDRVRVINKETGGAICGKKKSLDVGFKKEGDMCFVELWECKVNVQSSRRGHTAGGLRGKLGYLQCLYEHLSLLRGSKVYLGVVSLAPSRPQERMPDGIYCLLLPDIERAIYRFHGE